MLFASVWGAELLDNCPERGFLGFVGIWGIIEDTVALKPNRFKVGISKRHADYIVPFPRPRLVIDEALQEVCKFNSPKRLLNHDANLTLNGTQSSVLSPQSSDLSPQSSVLFAKEPPGLVRQ